MGVKNVHAMSKLDIIGPGGGRAVLRVAIGGRLAGFTVGGVRPCAGKTVTRGYGRKVELSGEGGPRR
jgi:hypothetical protein